MTKLPIDDRRVHGFDGPEYQLSRICARGGCFERATEAHHIWRRSHVGDHNWVILPDGSAAGNIVMLCREHHRLITENEAQIRFEHGSFYWVQDGVEYLPLAFQPPWVIAELENAWEEESRFENPGTETGADQVLENECPTCRQPLPRPKPPQARREPRRPRRSWTITVPVDERENGAALLDEKLEDARLEMERAGLGYGPERNVRYFVLATILDLFVLHSRELLGDA